MATGGKYGRVTVEHGSIPDDEPVFVLRAQDRLTPQVLDAYAILLEKAGVPQRDLALIRQRYDEIVEWQEDHETRTPDSETTSALPGR